MIEQIASTTFQELMPTSDRVEIGDIDSVDFKPHLKLNRWNGECFIKVGLPITEKSLPIIDGNKITWEGRDKHILMYPLAPDKQMELGGYEYEIVFDKKPKSNKIIIDLQGQGLKFDYQPSLTQEEIEEGHIRPENVVGGYAVSHATKGGMVSSRGKNYKAGEAFFIYRPRIIDARGDWAWEEQFINPITGKQIITIPQEFLKYAHYPIRHVAGDTFGYTDVGGTGTPFGGGAFLGMPGTPSAGTAQSISLYCVDTGDNFKGVLILGADKTILANGVGNPAGIAFSADWVISSFGIDPTLTNAEHFVGAVSDNLINIYYNSGTGNQRWFDATNSYATPTDPTDGSQSSTRYSIYCIYTPAGGVDHTKSLSDIVAIADTIVKAVGGFKSDSVPVADTLSKAVGLYKAETLTISDVISKAVGLFKVETLTIVDTFTRAVDFIRTYSDTVTIADVLSKAVGLIKSEKVTITDSIAKAIGIFKAETLSITDSGIVRSCTALFRHPISRMDTARLMVSRMAIRRLDAARMFLIKCITRRF